MQDLKTLTVRALRELARKHLGRGHSRLKTKEELIDALRSLPSAVKSALSKPAKDSRHATPQPERRKASERASDERKAKDVQPERQTLTTEPSRPTAERPSDEEEERDEAPVPVSVVTFEKASEDARTPKQRWGTLQAPPKKPAEGANYGGAALGKGAKSLSSSHVSASHRQDDERAPSPQGLPPARPATPKPSRRPAAVREGFFHVRGGARPTPRRSLGHRPGPAPAAALAIDPDEELGKLPAAYGSDAAVLLVRDPSTVYFFWELSAPEQLRAVDGLVTPRTLLRVFAGTRLLGEEEVALSEKGHYLRGLPQGEPLRVEVHAVGEGGFGKKLIEAGLPDGLPRLGPSPDQSVQFLRVPPDESLSHPKPAAGGGQPQSGFAAVPPPSGSLPSAEFVEDMAMEPLGSSDRLQKRTLRGAGLPGDEGDARETAEGGERPTLGSSERLPWRRSPSGRN